MERKEEAIDLGEKCGIGVALLPFRQNLKIYDQGSKARYADGSGGCDEYVIVIVLDDHGKPMDAVVEDFTIAPKKLFINASVTRDLIKQKP